MGGWRASGAILLAVLLAGCEDRPRADPGDSKQVARGAALYASHCASCHGANLEGQPKWRDRLPNGRLPAPPHDASGHTWHHTDEALFGIVKNGMTPYAGAAYESDMPAFAKVLSDDEIHAILAFIKSGWPQAIREKQAQIGAAGR